MARAACRHDGASFRCRSARRDSWSAVGSRGTTVRTEDGGRSWSASTLPGDFTFSGIRFISATRGWMVGEFGVIFQTKDGGKSWVKQKSPVKVSFSSGASQNLFALLFTAPTEGYAFGLDGLVLETRDGSRWEIIRQRESANSAGATDHLFAAGFSMVVSSFSSNAAPASIRSGYRQSAAG